MTTLQTLTIIFSLGFLSCNSHTEKSVKIETQQIGTVSSDTTSKPKFQPTTYSDTIKRLIVDDYPVTNKMLAAKPNNTSAYKKQSGQTYSYDKVWFGNDILNQTLVFELYTDYHRMVIYDFNNNEIPTDLINRMELHTDDGELASRQQKLKDFNGFLKQETEINSTYFISDKGFKLGDKRKLAIDTYGEPDKNSIIDGIEILEWRFIGDEFYDGKTNLKGKPLARDSFGYQIVMYFKNGKLIGQILYNNIP